MTLAILFVLVAVSAYFLFIKKASTGNKASAKRSVPPQPPARANGPPHHWRDTQKFEFHVVGESYYQAHIAAVVGDHDESYTKVRKIAMLVPERDNPHDDKAVGVYIDGAKVGHLSRDDARRFRNRLRAKKIAGEETTCDAEVRGGKAKNGAGSTYDVFLAIKPFAEQ